MNHASASPKEIDRAINLIKQGKKKEAQSILYDLIRSNPHEINAWFWYIETLETLEKRIQCLEACLKQNPGNSKVIRALDIVQVKQTAKSQFVSGSPMPKRITSNTTGHDKSKLPSYVPHGDTLSATDSYVYGQDEKDSAYTSNATSMPDINIPVNQKVIAFLKNNLNIAAVFPYQDKMIGSYQDIWDYNRYPNICDVTDYFMRMASGLPEDTKYLIYGWTALVHPKSRIIFGFIRGDTNYYFLPEKVIKDLLDRKKIANHQINHPELREGWVSSLTGYTNKLVNKIYDYNGSFPNKEAEFRLSLQEDFVSQKSQSVHKAINLIYLVAFLLAIFLLGAFTAYLKLRGRGIIP